MHMQAIPQAAPELSTSFLFHPASSSLSGLKAVGPLGASSKVPEVVARVEPKTRKDAFSGKVGEKSLVKMADALSLGRIARLRAPTGAAQKGVPHFVLLFDFDHTLSTEDSGEKLAREHHITNPTEIFARMASEDPSVRPGGELAAALAHAPEFRHITKQDLSDAGQGVGLKANVKTVFDSLEHDGNDYRLSLFVLSAGPTETIRTALTGVVAPEKVQGTKMQFGQGNEKEILHVTAGQGKADFIDALLQSLDIPASHLMFAGDGSSDEVAFRYGQERGAFNILVKDNPKLFPLSNAQVYGDDLVGVIGTVKGRVADVLMNTPRAA